MKVDFFQIHSHTELPINDLVDILAKGIVDIPSAIKNERVDRFYPQEKIDYFN